MATYQRVIALDLARVTGLAVWRDGRRSSLVHTFAAAAGVPERLVWDYREWFGTVLREVRPEVVLFERPVTRGRAAEYLKAMGWETRVAAWRAEAVCLDVHAATLKKHATGHGNATKTEMVAAARARGWTARTDDEADALWLLDYGLVNLNKATTT